MSTGPTTGESDWRWVIPDIGDSAVDEPAHWKSVHEAGYEDVFSVGDSQDNLQRIIEACLATHPSSVLIAGCGSRTDLQQRLVEQSDAHIVAMDFSPVIAIAERRFSHDRLHYTSLETMDREQRFDSIVAINVLVSASDRQNRSMLATWSSLLSPGGRVISLMPIFSCGLEWVQLSGRSDLAGHLQIANSTWHEIAEDRFQVEYLPLRLRRIVHEAGLEIETLEIVFFEDEPSRQQVADLYNLDDADIILYEQLLVARQN